MFRGIGLTPESRNTFVVAEIGERTRRVLLPQQNFVYLVINGEVALEVHQDSTRIRVEYSTGAACSIGGDSVYWLVER